MVTKNWLQLIYEMLLDFTIVLLINEFQTYHASTWHKAVDEPLCHCLLNLLTHWQLHGLMASKPGTSNAWLEVTRSGFNTSNAWFSPTLSHQIFFTLILYIAFNSLINLFTLSGRNSSMCNQCNHPWLRTSVSCQPNLLQLVNSYQENATT